MQWSWHLATFSSVGVSVLMGLALLYYAKHKRLLFLG